MRSVRGLGLTFLARRARASSLLLACLAATVLISTGLAAVLWSFAVAVIPQGAGSALAAPQGRVMKLTGVTNAGEAAADSKLIRGTLREAWPGVRFQMQSALWAEPVQLSITSSGTYSTQIQPASLAGLRARVTLTAGKWPGAPRPGSPVPVALPAAAASRLHVGLGSVLTGSPPSGGPKVSLLVTGLFQAKHPAALYWGVDLVASSGITVQHYTISTAGSSEPATTVSYGPAVLNPAAFSGGLAVTQASWLVLPQANAMAHGNVFALAARTTQAVSKLSVALPEGLQVTSRLPQLLDGLGSTSVLARSLFTIAALMLLLVAGAGLALAARLLASLREDESALLRARGATRWQLARPVLAEAVLLGVAAGSAGVLIGTRLTGVLARLGDLRVEGHLSGSITSLAWLSALVMLVLCAAVMAWPALQAVTPGAARLRRARQARLAGMAWAGGDLAVLALAVVAVWELRGYSAVAHPGPGSLGIDPVVAIAPALALAGLTLIPLRGLPLLARLADKVTDYERRLAAAMVSWQIARQPIRQAGPALLVVIATATTTLGLAGYASWRQSVADQAAFTVGSDVRVDAVDGVPPTAAGRITRAPGVTAATVGSVAGIGHGGELIALDANTASKAILLRPDLSPLPVGALWRRIHPHPIGETLPGAPARLAILAAIGRRGSSSAAEIRRYIGSPTATAWIQDATGVIYQLPAGRLPADGQPHALVVTLPGRRLASYPLRLIGLTLSFVVPPYDRSYEAVGPTATLTIESLAVSKTARGQFAAPFRHGDALSSWASEAYSPSVPTGPSGAYGQIPTTDGVGPFAGLVRRAGQAARIPFQAGHDPSPKIQREFGFDAAQAFDQLMITAQPATASVPAIATDGFLAANRLHLGSFTSVSPDGGPGITVHIVASVRRFPTVFGQNRALIVDYGAVNGLLAANLAQPLPVTTWWLRTVGGRVPRLPAGLGLSVVTTASQRAALLSNPLLTAPRQAMLAIGVVAVLLGVLGFSVSVAASLRARRTQSAVFAALGIGKTAQAAQLCLEQCVLSVPAAAAGLLAGIGLAHLLVPAVTLTTDAAAPVPWALVVVPLGPAVALALVTAAAPVAAAALSVLRRPDPAAQLRAEAV